VANVLTILSTLLVLLSRFLEIQISLPLNLPTPVKQCFKLYESQIMQRHLDLPIFHAKAFVLAWFVLTEACDTNNSTVCACLPA